jgi:hypothetical protein
MNTSLAETLRRYAHNSDASWSCGSFGAIAEFARDVGEPAKIADRDGITVVTERGGLHINFSADIRPIAYELPGKHPAAWQQALALCLPVERCCLTGRDVLTELGADAEALDPANLGAILFDLGLAVSHAEICVRTSDAQAIALLRSGRGRSLLSPDGLSLLREVARLSPHRVFRCRFGRIEVYQRVPGPKDRTPAGPHTHVLPRLLALRRTHAATLPVPPGYVPCMTLFPPSPIAGGHDGVRRFDETRYAEFQALWNRYGVPELVALKSDVFESLSLGESASSHDLPPPLDRVGRATVRVALRQWRQLQQA